MSERPRTRHRAVGPFAPPLPTEAEESQGGEPMAVANDKANIHGESFLATSAPRDQFDDEVARRYGRHVEHARSNEETRAMQSPERYTKPNGDGWAELKEEE